MANIEFEDDGSIDPPPSIKNENIYEILLKLSLKVDSLTNSIKTIEQKIDDLSTNKGIKILKSEVEVEESASSEEDYLTPNDIIDENPAIKNTGIELIKKRIATASEIARVTKKERAVESFYLNDLWSRNRIRKLRIGRKIYFYIGRSNEIMPFKNPIIKPEWRDVLISIIRELTSFETPKKVKIKNIIKNYIDCLQSEEIIDNSSNLIDIETNLLKLLEEISEKTNFVLSESGNEIFKREEEKLVFDPLEWLKLAY